MISHHRHLAALLFTDIVGYTAMMQHDEQMAVMVFKRHNSTLKAVTASFDGEVINDYGDGSLSIFSSATDAVYAALEIQKQFREEPSIPVRIGLHIGEIFFEDDKILGDGVNIASRIQSIAQANTILFSKEFFDKIKNQPGFKCEPLGSFKFKNVDEPVEVFALATAGLHIPKRDSITGKLSGEAINIRQGLKRLRKPALLIATLFFIALLANYIFSDSSRQRKGKKSIVILPFTSRGEDTMEDDLTDRMRDVLSDYISRIGNLEVIAKTSALKYKNENTPLSRIGRQLGVDYCLRSSLSKEDDKISLNVNLFDTKTEGRKWNKTYHSKSRDLFNTASDIARKIAVELNLTLSDEEMKKINSVPTKFMDAFEWYSKGRNFLAKRTKRDIFSAIDCFKKATGIDPSFALAWSGIADCYTILGDNGLMPADSVKNEAKDAIRIAFLLDSSLAEVRASYAIFLSSMTGNSTDAIKELDMAIRQNPNYASAYQWYALELSAKGQFDKALQLIEKAIRLDPLSDRIYFSQALIYYYSRQFNQAVKQINSGPATIKLDRQYTQFLSRLYIYLHKIDSAMYYARASRDDLLLLILQNKFKAASEFLNKNRNKYTLDEMATYYALMNQKDSALLWLNKAVEGKEYSGLKFLAVGPEWDNLRSDTRFSLLLQNSGIH